MADARQRAADPYERAHARVGSSISGRWQLDSLIGIGGMAAVYAATDTASGEVAALKVLHDELATDEAQRAWFLREAEITGRIGHVGVVRIVETGVAQGGLPYIAMELLQGVAVDGLARRKGGRIPLTETLLIADQALEVLAEAHRLGIVHRDLKPENLFVSGTGAVKVLDFGVAFVRGEGSEPDRAGVTLGTPAFMSPEQAQGAGAGVDQRSDIFSLGATIYSLLSGQKVHEAATSDQAFVQAATMQATSLARVAPELPLSVIRLVDRALAWDARERFQGAEEMRDELLRCLGEENRDLSGSSIARSNALKASAGALMAALSESEEMDPDEVKGRVRDLREFFRGLNQLFYCARRFGWKSQETLRRGKSVHTQVLAALVQHVDGLYWKVSPYSFQFRGEDIWAPEPPWDEVPYNLFASGFRLIRFLPGISEEELYRFLGMMILDARKELAPEDDFATVFWGMELQYVQAQLLTQLKLDDFDNREEMQREMDATQEEAREMVQAGLREQMAAAEMLHALGRDGVVEAHAMNIRVDGNARDTGLRVPTLALGEGAAERIAAALESAAASVPERLPVVLSEAWMEARAHGDPGLVAEPLVEFVADELASAGTARLLSLFLGMRRRLRDPAEIATLVEVLFPQPVVLTLLAELSPESQEQGERKQPSQSLLEDARGVLEFAPAVHFGAVNVAMMRTRNPAVAAALLPYLERNAAGHAAELGDVLPGAEPETALRVIRILAADPGADARAALRRAEENPSPAVRLEAIGIRAKTEPNEIVPELGKLLDHEDKRVRARSIEVIEKAEVIGALPLLVARIEAESFHDRLMQERRALLSALFATAPRKAEALAIRIAKKHGVMVNEVLDSSRRLCVELLAQRGESAEALEALEAASKGRWWNSAELQKVATAALTQARVRVGTARSA